MFISNLKKLYTTTDVDTKKKIEEMLAQNQIQHVSIIDDMFWKNFMGGQRFAADKKEPQSYSIYVYKTYRNEAFIKAKTLIQAMK